MGVSFWLCAYVLAIQARSHPLLPSHARKQGAGPEMEQWDITLIPACDAGVAGCGLNYYTRTPTPESKFFILIPQLVYL